MREIVELITTEELDQVRGLMTAFVAWSGERYIEYLDQVNAYLMQRRLEPNSLVFLGRMLSHMVA